MAIIKWEPMRNMSMLQDRINRLFEDAFPKPEGSGEDLCDAPWTPPVDIHDSDQGVVVRVDLPGVAKEDIRVEVKDNQLIIQGIRQPPADVQEEQYYRRERACGSFRRAFALLSSVAPDTINASFKDGVLTVTVPEPREEKPKKISVNID